jgi:uncharacterized protein YbgA (DUF1722 family)
MSCGRSAPTAWTRDLLDHVWHRLEGQALLDRADLRESIEQLRHGDVVVLRPLADEDAM